MQNTFFVFSFISPSMMASILQNQSFLSYFLLLCAEKNVRNVSSA